MKRFLHLDFKGIAPEFSTFGTYLKFFKSCGFDGIVFEFDCRLKWRTWQDAGMPVYSIQEAASMVADAEKAGFETIPLIQIQGHMEWILGEEKYAGLREDGRLTLCPTHEQAIPLLEQWVQEVRSIFPNSKILHLGADEVADLARCPRCKAAAGEDKHQLYLSHVSKICNIASAYGFRPMIWGDMLLATADPAAAAAVLPQDTIIVDWKYWGQGARESTTKLQSSGLEVWGASGVRCAWYEHFRTMLDQPLFRLENIAGWNNFDGNVIHTCWGRPGNKWNLYPPWHMSIMEFIAAGSSEAFAGHPWHDRFLKLANALMRKLEFEIMPLWKEIPSYPVADEFEAACRDYLYMAVEYELLINNYYEWLFGLRAVTVSEKYVGRNPAVYQRFFVDKIPELQARADSLAERLLSFFEKHKLCGGREFVEEKMAAFVFEKQL